MSVSPPADGVELRGARDGLVAFLYGVAGAPELPGVVLTELLGEFGMSVAAARRQVARMRAEGRLASVRSGRGASYRLAGPFGVTFTRLRGDRGEPAAPPDWPGFFHGLLYQVPESHRRYRNLLRRQAVTVGYGVLQPGVLIATQDRSAELAGVVDDQPEGAQIHHARIGMDLVDAAVVVARAWDLDGLATELHARLDELKRALAEAADPPPTAATLRRMAALVTASSVTLIGVPALPKQLRPPNWPVDRVQVALDLVKDRYLPASAQYVHTLSAAVMAKA